MTKQEAIEILRRRNRFEDEIYRIIKSTNTHFINPSWLSFDELKGIIEALSDNEYTIKYSEPQQIDVYYVVRVVETKPYYSEYWS